ncbi:MAG: lectin MOA-related protein [Nitrosopumilus sp.]|nr:lectin MOA-related protein [Nitrosopumilus sp.]MDH3735389.1 lectin MOA-related protein [Nitrosopumilus sp.]MDH3822249.1 lectin MOA-related protein [Nitrosopumilus sp.]MDH3832577.1 lectin MOA-related protein [Nitrosopumilus sp.]
MAKRVFLTGRKLENLLYRKLKGKILDDASILLADEKYYCPPQSDIEYLIKRNKINRKKYTSEIFDCDDFALSLKYFFIKHAYSNGKRRAPHCAGIIWGFIGGEQHAVNIVVNDKKEVFFIEPQKDLIFFPDDEDTDFSFIYF